MNRMTTRRYEVVIVGGGPVGCGLAIELGQRGIECALVERRERPQRIPKGQNLTQRTMEHFFFWGVEDEVRSARLLPKDYPIGGVTAYETLLGDYSYAWYRRDVVADYYFTRNERLPQYETERVLRSRVGELPTVDPYIGWSATGVHQSADGVVVTASAGDGSVRSIEGAYAVGCDGSNSLVRAEAAIDETRSGHDKRMVLLVFRSPELHRILHAFEDKSFFNVLHPELDGYWRFLGRVDLGNDWFFHAPVPPETTTENFDFAELLHTAVGTGFGCEFQHIGFWDLRVAFANHYRNGRVFIAGDAAHSHPPYGAFGVNTGFEDARNLGWKLAATLRGWGSDRLLESYSEERLPVFTSTARDFIEAFIARDRDFVRRFDPRIDRTAFEVAWEERRAQGNAAIQRFEPHYEGSPLVSGPPDGTSAAVGTHERRARPGHHLTPGRLTSGRDVHEALGTGLTLLAFDADDADTARFAEAARSLAVPFDIVADTRRDGREQYGSRLVLVRPDQFVSWCGDEAPTDTASALAASVGRDSRV